MPGSVKLRSIKRFGQENDGYEFSAEGEECGMLRFKYTVVLKLIYRVYSSTHIIPSAWSICNDMNMLIPILERDAEYM